MSTAEKIREEGMLEGIIKGRLEGRLEGRSQGEALGLAKSAIRLLTKKFGALPKEKREKIMQMDSVALEQMIDKILDFESMDEADRYLH